MNGYGAILSQKFPEGERVISYASKSTNSNEKNYTATELEAAALMWAIDKYRIYLVDKEIIHKALKAFKNISEGNHKLLRWSLKIQDVKFNVVYKNGPTIPHVDCLSRNIGENCEHKINAIVDIKTFCLEQAKDPQFKRIYRKIAKLAKIQTEDELK